MRCNMSQSYKCAQDHVLLVLYLCSTHIYENYHLTLIIVEFILHILDLVVVCFLSGEFIYSKKVLKNNLDGRAVTMN